MRQSPNGAKENAAVPKERLLFLNDACMVINKLSGESSESICLPADIIAARNIPTGKLQSDRYPTDKYPVPVHRLDMPVTGCLLLARNPGAAAFLGKAFAGHEGRVVKRYWAIIEKPPPDTALPSTGELVHWLSENRKANKSYANEVCAAFPYAANEGPPAPKGRLKKAILRYRLTGEGDHYLFMEIDLVTGRRHQIRSQLAALGLHIKGDLKYGARRSEKAGGIRLHACSLAFPNPLNPDETITVKAPPPVMDSLWTAFTNSLN
ncbi:MAG: RNA pseudouridine synthase [Treponema sp.]|jgi:23S rRNA pseudouridine1911/1915/1917 synthase|nr:RNA pseudouridine synthase [Treponema sp.]